MKLHLGCGKRYLPGYTHIDLAKYDHIDYKMDVKDLNFIPAGSAALIYASHVLEYFDREEAAQVLRNWRSCLRTGGTLRLAVPDFDALMELYMLRNDLDLILGPLYGRWPIEGSERCVYHKTTYNFRGLKDLLESVGFSDVKRWNWREVFTGALKGFDDYSQAYFPHMDKENGKLISLNVECTK